MPTARSGAADDAINDYGDRFVPAGAAGYGPAISQQREDSLDAAALQSARRLLLEAAPARQPMVYDVGAGHGAMAIKFALAGCAVVACDLAPMPALRAFAGGGHGGQVRVIDGRDARDVEWHHMPPPDLVYSQRFLHYLPFPDAIALVRALVRPGHRCIFYLSMSGLDSELARGYPALPLEARFAALREDLMEKHGIRRPVCLYTLADALVLAESCGLDVTELWRSEFGNVKLVAEYRGEG